MSKIYLKVTVETGFAGEPHQDFIEIDRYMWEQMNLKERAEFCEIEAIEVRNNYINYSHEVLDYAEIASDLEKVIHGTWDDRVFRKALQIPELSVEDRSILLTYSRGCTENLGLDIQNVAMNIREGRF